jgi:hypothetical protein
MVEREPTPGTPRTGLRRVAACRDGEARSPNARGCHPRSRRVVKGDNKGWNLDGARGCNWWQTVANRPGTQGAKQAKTVAVGCHPLRKGAHGKEGVDGSSPSEGSAKAPHVGAFTSSVYCISSSLPRYGTDFGTPRRKRASSCRLLGQRISDLRLGREGVDLSRRRQ